jgi:hypothetical protein
MNSSFFVDRTGAQPETPELWRPVIITKASIDTEVRRLASLPKPPNGRRRALIVHPQGSEHGLAPGIQVALDVLLPGESTVGRTPPRSTS